MRACIHQSVSVIWLLSVITSAFNSNMHMTKYACVLMCAVLTACACDTNNTDVAAILQSNLTKYLQVLQCSSTLHSNWWSLLSCIEHHVCSSWLHEKHANATSYHGNSVAELLRCMHLRMHFTMSTYACAYMQTHAQHGSCYAHACSGDKD